MTQDKEQLNNWYSSSDPWGYELNPDDSRRRENLLAELPPRDYRKVLDIGCGQGFITKSLPGKQIVGVDVSDEAIRYARSGAPVHISFVTCDLFDLGALSNDGKYDLIIITGVLYEQYIGKGHELVKIIIDDLLAPGGVLVSVHIAQWYRFRFPYPVTKQLIYPYRNYNHILEIYVK